MIFPALALLGLAIYLLPLSIGAIIRSLSPSRLLGANCSERDFNARTGAVKAFLSGLSAGISAYDPTIRRSYRTLTSFERPFYIEGASAGLRISGYLAPWRARRNFRKLWREHPDFIFLLVIGLGFSSGLQRFWTSSIDSDSISEFNDIIDPSLRLLFYDGYAFQKFIFGYGKIPALLSSGQNLEAEIRRGFYGGAGRALWFLVPDFGAFQALIAGLPKDCRAECLVGFGLATGFAGCESIASGSLATYPRVIESLLPFQLGLTIGLFARYYIEPEFVKELLGLHQLELLNTVKDAAAMYREFRSRSATYEQWRYALELKLKNGSKISMAVEQSPASMA